MFKSDKSIMPLVGSNKFNYPPTPPESLSKNNSASDAKDETERSAASETDKPEGTRQGNDTEGKQDDSKSVRKRLSGDIRSFLVPKKMKMDDCPRSSTAKEGGGGADSPSASSDDQSSSQSSDDSTSDESSSGEDNDAYEVEEILDYWVEEGEQVFLIKWKGWDKEEDNTWEKAENMDSCPEKLADFYKKRLAEVKSIKEQYKRNPKRLEAVLSKCPIPPDPRTRKEQLKDFYENLKDERVELTKEFLEAALKTGPPQPQWNKKQMDEMIFKSQTETLTASQIKTMKIQVAYALAKIAQHELSETWKRWEDTMNAVAKGRPQIYVENLVDLDLPPAKFQYINEYQAGKNVTIPRESPVMCECTPDCHTDKKNCCPSTNEGLYAYSKDKRIIIAPGSPVYECNNSCKCDETCTNRVVQDGTVSLQGFKICIFKTASGKGWGAKTLKKIKKGTFVAVYAGEIIEQGEAEERGKTYDDQGLTYLFDLDFNAGEEDPAKYVIDACMMGNVSHFFNHSCSPNLNVYNVFVDCIDANLPKLAFFASKDIQEGEELTFDYQANSKQDQILPEETTKKYKCRCGSKSCRKYLFY